MKSERWRQIDQILKEALDLEENQRTDFLEQACGEDEALRKKVEALLVAHKRGENFLGEPALEMAARGIAQDQIEALVGKQIGSYKILSLLGAGGMGEVYLAQDSKLDRKVALKFLPEELQQDAAARKRFLREAKSAAALDHPYICHIHEVGEVEGKSFISMEYVQGKTLKDKLANGLLPLKDALEKAAEVAEALEEAHKRGIVHRDIKPANIMLTPQGHVKVMDFGLAKQVMPAEGQEQEITTALTKQGSTLGTVPYMSPEQVRGQVVDTRSDIFSFGVVLYEMLAGVNPFAKGSAMDTAHAILGETPPPLTRYRDDISVLLQHTVKKMLAKEPDRRYQSSHEVRSNLGELLEESGDSIREVATGLPGASPTPAWWRRAIPWSVTALMAAIAGVAVWSVMSSAPPRLARFAISEPTVLSTAGYNTPTVTISPDGTRIVHVGPEGQLYVRAIDQLDSVALRGGVGINPFISSDGNWVGFRGPDLDLKKVSIHGGPPVVISEGFGVIVGASWGADDNIIFGTVSNGLFRLSAAGGEEREQLTNLEEGESAHRWPEILPGGRTVLFAVEKGQGDANHEIAALDLETGERKLLIPGGSNPQYAATGHIVYGIDGTLRAVPFDLDAVEVKGDPIPVLEGVVTEGRGAAHFSLAEDGTLVYVPGTGGAASERKLGLADRYGEVEHLNMPTKEYLSPRLSPDGKTLAVQSVEDSKNVIWVYDLSGDTAIQQLTFEGNNSRPVWTPDSQRITFSSDRDGAVSLYWMPADGSGVAERLTTAEEGTSHWTGSWSPDGELLVFTVVMIRDLQTERGIWTLSVDDRETQSLYDAPGTMYTGAELSPNGEWLAYGMGPSVILDIYVEPFPPTGSRHRISQNGGYWPMWSPEGNELFYRPTAGTTSTLRSVDIVTEPAFGFSNEQTLPMGGFTVVSGYRSFDISPDGERLVMMFPADQPDSGEPARPQINVVLNWFEELKERVPVP